MSEVRHSANPNGWKSCSDRGLDSIVEEFDTLCQACDGWFPYYESKPSVRRTFTSGLPAYPPVQQLYSDFDWKFHYASSLVELLRLLLEFSTTSTRTTWSS